MDRDRRIVGIVGSAGFIGRAAMSRLESEQVECVPFTRNSPLVRGVHLAEAAGRCHSFVWLASSINPLLAETSPELVTKDNENLADALSLINRLPNSPRVVFVSSGGTVYGRAAPPHRETERPKPCTAYGHAKLALEETLSKLVDDSVILRLSNAYGPGQPVARGQGVVAHWLRAIRRHEPVRLYGDVRTSRDYVYIEDVVDAIERAVVSAKPPPLMNIGSGEPTSLAELLDIVLRAVDPQGAKVEYVAGRSFDIPSSYLDVSLARTAMGWEARTGLDDGVRRTWEASRVWGDTIA